MAAIIACLFILAFIGLLYYLDYRTRKQMRQDQLLKP